MVSIKNISPSQYPLFKKNSKRTKLPSGEIFNLTLLFKASQDTLPNNYCPAMGFNFSLNFGGFVRSCPLSK